MSISIGVYATNLGVEPGYEQNVSGHAQIPLHAARLLHEAGHEVRIIGTMDGPGQTMPQMLPDLPFHRLVDPRARSAARPPSTRPLRAVHHAIQLVQHVASSRIDLLHAFGAPRTAASLGLLRRLGLIRVPIVFTLLRPLPAASQMPPSSMAAIDIFTTSTSFLAASVDGIGLHSSRLRHGAIRALLNNTELRETPDRVLFWREATWQNGCDLVVSAFDSLASRFPDLRFSLALRPSRQEVQGIPELSAKHPNVEVFRFPYDEGPDLATLVAESLLICLPFRRQTLHPQLSVLESLDAGVPTVVLDVGDMGEVIDHHKVGVLATEPTSRHLEAQIQYVLEDRPLLESMTHRLRTRANSWTWSRFASDAEVLYAHALRQ